MEGSSFSILSTSFPLPPPSAGDGQAWLSPVPWGEEGGEGVLCVSVTISRAGRSCTHRTLQLIGPAPPSLKPFSHIGGVRTRTRVRDLFCNLDKRVCVCEHEHVRLPRRLIQPIIVISSHTHTFINAPTRLNVRLASCITMTRYISCSSH